MPRLPRSNNWINHQTNANLVTYAQQVHDLMLVTNIANFPDSPVTPIQFQNAINAYSTQLSASIKGSFEDRSLMRALRAVVRNMLQQLSIYVNQVVTAGLSAGQSYDELTAVVALSGLQAGKQPAPIGPMPQPTIKRYGSNYRGQLNILIKPKIIGAKTYNLVWGLTGTDQSTWTTDPFPDTRINKIGLTSGTSVDWYIFAKGSNPVSTATAIKTSIIT
jgi:hypothetical protein